MSKQSKSARTLLTALVLTLGFCLTSLPAGVVDIQLSGIDEIVRVSQQADGTGSRGTGSIFRNFYNSDEDQRYLCVITADHVLKNGNGGSIAFGNTPYATNVGPFFASVYSVLGQFKGIHVPGDPIRHHPDLAVMVVPVHDTPFFQGLVPFNLVTPVDNEHDFTLRGFGLTGPLTDIQTAAGGRRFAYIEDLMSYGTQRFSNNTITEYELRDDGKYRDISSLFTIDAPPGGILGEGTGMRGDSGGPMLNRELVATLLSNNTVVPGFTKDIEGIFTRAVTREDVVDGRFIVDFGNVYAGVTMIPPYINWAHRECSRGVPEPSTQLLIIVALLAVIRVGRRR